MRRLQLAAKAVSRRNPHEPSYFEPDDRTENIMRGEIRTAGLGIATAHLREADDDQCHQKAAEKKCEEAVNTDECEHSRRQAEYSGPNDGVQHDRREVPTPKNTNESLTCRLYHSIFRADSGRI